MHTEGIRPFGKCIEWCWKVGMWINEGNDVFVMTCLAFWRWLAVSFIADTIFSWTILVWQTHSLLMLFLLGWYLKILWHNRICQWPVGRCRAGWTRREEQWKCWKSPVLQVCTKTRYNLYFIFYSIFRPTNLKSSGRYELFGRIKTGSRFCCFSW